MRDTEIEWQGEVTIEDVAERLRRHGHVEVILPHNFNHAVFEHLCDETQDLEQIDVEGGSELVQAIATVDGLEDLRGLVDVVVHARAQVRIISPPRIIIVSGTE